MVAALVGACGGPPPAVFAAAPGTRVALIVVVREEIVETGAARRLEVAARGVHEGDGSVRFEVLRAALERRDAKGGVDVVSTHVVGADVAARDAADTPTVKLLESLRAAGVTIRLDPGAGLTSVEGLDLALDLAVAGDASLGETRSGLRAICSDENWRYPLAAAGLCKLDRAIWEGGSIERNARIRVPGHGWTTLTLGGTVARAADGLPAATLSGRLASDAEFDPDGSAPPSADVGAARVGDVTGSATTSCPPAPGPPFKGEFTLTVPFAGGATLRTTTTFTWTRP